jgi:hypothetical protein
MTVFPTLVPNEIGFDMGRANISEVSTFAGPVRFRHSKAVNNQNLRVVYRGLSQAQVETLRQHYFDNQASLTYFTVPAAIWGGVTVVSSSSLYRYASPLQEEQLGLYYNVSFSLLVIDGVSLLYVLDGGNAVVPPTTPFMSFAFAGYQPFTLNCGGASVTATLVLQGGGASQ